jgi:tripartite ATP-independent transporter DctM subunit
MIAVQAPPLSPSAIANVPLAPGWRFVARFENTVALTVLAAMTVLPIIEVIGRLGSGIGVPGAIVLVQHLTLWIALAGAALAARSDQLLALSTARLLPARWQARVRVFTRGVAVAVTAALVIASTDFIRIERAAGSLVALGIPTWWVLAVLPVGFALILVRIVWRAGEDWRGRATAALGIAVPLVLALVPPSASASLLLPAGLVIVAGTALGMPIFAAIGGAALVLYWGDATPLNAVPGETYRLTTSTMLPAVPLFALGGYILAAGGASRRLTRLFTALVGWMPGGLAIVTTGVLAFFTPLTGASGVTIVSMGGLLLPVLVGAGYPRATSLGLVTVSGSIGLLFFPSLPVFLYGFYANQPFDRLFVGGVVPGLLLVVAVAGWAAARGGSGGATRTPFHPREAADAIWDAKWELGLPTIVLGTIVTGTASLVEAAALTVVYALLVEVVVHRTLGMKSDVVRIGLECATLIGGFLIILSVALGFTSYLILLEVPVTLVAWVRAHIESPILFLLALNVLLILAGAMMDIYSAIVVFVPLITPMAAAYGIDPVHLGVIFLANMELGYLMPPMGENLFLSSYRFERPLAEVYRSTLPYSVIVLVVVLLITYVPGLTLWLVHLLEGRGML